MVHITGGSFFVCFLVCSLNIHTEFLLIYKWFNDKGSFSVHSFNDDYLSTIYLSSAQVAERTNFRKSPVPQVPLRKVRYRGSYMFVCVWGGGRRMNMNLTCPERGAWWPSTDNSPLYIINISPFFWIVHIDYLAPVSLLNTRIVECFKSIMGGNYSPNPEPKTSKLNLKLSIFEFLDILGLNTSRTGWSMDLSVGLIILDTVCFLKTVLPVTCVLCWWTECTHIEPFQWHQL